MERINKFIANCGVCSRRKADVLIEEGRISVNDKIIKELGYKVLKKDIVKFDGKVINPSQFVYYILNKPKNIISSTADEKNRKTVIDLVKENGIEDKVYPVGRLDYNTSGLLLLTNDGDFSNSITHPKRNIEKEYLLRVSSIVPKALVKEANLKKFVLYNNVKYRFKSIKITEFTKDPDTTQLKIIVSEGKNHQVRNIFKALGFEVYKLTRTRIHNINIDTIGRGYIRKLKIKELKDLKNIKK